MDIKISIITLQVEATTLIEQLAFMAYEAFREHAPTWLPTVQAAKAEVLESLEPQKISLVLVDATDQPLGWIGAIPQNGGRVWEIHPLVIAATAQGQGYGRELVHHLERLAQADGVLTLIAGTSDETQATTLSGVDLYQNPATAIGTIRNLKKHPYKFYEKIGFKVVGVMPDAEGIGKPGITLAKRVRPRANGPI